MNQLRLDVEEFVQTVSSMDRLLKRKNAQITHILKLNKNMTTLEKSIERSLQSFKKNEIKIEDKLMVLRLTANFKEAQKMFHNLNVVQRISDWEDDLQSSQQPTSSSVEPTLQTMEKNLNVREGFDLDRLRKRQKEIREVENTLVDTNEVFIKLSSIVKEQGESVDNIESNIEQVKENVKQGALEIRRARDYYFSSIKKLLPFAGAAIGAGLTGPVGLAYGFKLGGPVTIAASSVAGFVGGRFLSKKIESNQIEDDAHDAQD